MSLISLQTPNAVDWAYDTSRDAFHFSGELEGRPATIVVPAVYLGKLTISQIGSIAGKCMSRLREDLQAEIERNF